MTRGFTRWMVAPVLLLALTACTPLTDADGQTPTPVATPSSTGLSAWEKEQMGIFNESGILGELGVPEETPDPYTKETLPDPKGMVPEGVTNAATIGDIDATTTHRTLQLPKPSTAGDLRVDFACVDGNLEIGNDLLGTLGVECNGEASGFAFASEEGKKTMILNLTVSRGTSYSVAAFQDRDMLVNYD